MKSFFVAFSILVAASAAPAQQPLREQEFLAEIRDDHPSVLALGEELSRAEAARVRAGTLTNPRLEVLREQPDPNARQTTYTLSFAPPLDGRLSAAKHAAEEGLAAARLRLQYERLALRTELRRLYAGWEIAAERAAVLREQAATAGDLAAYARRRAAAGEASGISATRLELAAQEESGALALADSEAARALARIRALLPGLPADARPVRSELDAAAPGPGEVVRPDVEALRADVRQAEMEARLAGRFVAFPELTVGWQRVESRPSAQSGAVFGLAWSVPLLDRSQAARHEATRKRDVAEARLALREAQARAELAAARASYDALRQAAARAAEGTRGTARLVEGATAAFRAGETTVTELVDTLRAARDARLNEIDLYAAAWEAHRELEAATGRSLSNGGPR